MNPTIAGTLYAMAAFVAWGILPMYWKLLKVVPSPEILAHRIFWAGLFVNGMLFANGEWPTIRQTLAIRRNRIGILCSTVLISINWGLYIWAVNSDQIVEASLGYYINPLFSVVLGLVAFRERLNLWQWTAVGLATVGVLILTAQYGHVPWIALVLAFTFGLYGLSKKLVPVDALLGLGLETLLVAPLSLAYLAVKQVQGTGAFGAGSPLISFLFIFSGVVTAFPLFWFAKGAKMIPLSRVGFTQYLSPSISLFLGVVLYHEPFTSVHRISFGCIWCALFLYSWSQVSVRKG